MADAPYLEDAPLEEKQDDGGARDDLNDSKMKDDLDSPNRSRKQRFAGFVGSVGASPSSLAALAKGRCYFIDPYTPFTPRPETLNTRDSMVGPPLASYRSNHWVTQTSPGYVPKRLQNHRVPRTPPENKLGFPAKQMRRPATVEGLPRYMVNPSGHLLPKYRKPGRSAFPNVEEVGAVSWTFSKMGYV
mmetsp:Transcript_51976/g.105873  ORF Transcript_51976/g.105873 Transcript_51976/m.105873 type:complete len:188 (-) Transcript_51976:110-673(-)|eukprot:CAMPEP_0181311014 /NCGR_PEP_ID=MMETSP1101-20121128/12903_1 /TAXON_ID=46948 /ORGANISM="Rhodomonas abbreviata, Strain Caron Lab Isolate" /LENGTH=187 /DNA_ID=CAMNT_0023417701 /DNA_START=132 /DNA_END=695 /DNA_ORIENTATION=+